MTTQPHLWDCTCSQCTTALAQGHSDDCECQVCLARLDECTDEAYLALSDQEEAEKS